MTETKCGDQKQSHIHSNSPEGRVVPIALSSEGFHLGATVSHKPGQLLSHLLGFRIHWGGDFKQPISTGTQFTPYYCTVLNWPSHTTSLEPIGDKRRKEQGGTGVVNRELYGREAFTVTNERPYKAHRDYTTYSVNFLSSC